MYTLLLLLQYYAPSTTVLGNFNALSGLAIARSLNVAVISHETAKQRCILCVRFGAFVRVGRTASVVKQLNTCAVEWQLTE